MLRPVDFVAAARGLLALGGAGAAVLMLVPAFQGAEAALGLSDKQAHAAAFYLFTACAFLAAPRMRRNDLAMAVLALGAAAEVAQLVTGRSANAGDFLADAVGVGLVWVPCQLEHLRRMARRHPGLSFSQIRALDRRRRRPSAAPLGAASEARAP